MSGGQNPLLTAPYLNSRVVPQLVPLGWKSFQALAEEQVWRIESLSFAIKAVDSPGQGMDLIISGWW